jgi:predicted metal-dependent phosphoesterase TrpH
MARLLKVDFHCHTYHSPDSLTTIDKLVRSARQHGMDRIVVTDHNLLAGALEAKAEAPDLIIVGEEVQTTEGEFLAAFVTQEIPKGLEPMEALRQLRDQGAFISVSHPFDVHRSGWPLETLEKLAPLVDAIEGFNARVLDRMFNAKAIRFAHEHNLPRTAGSDAHHPIEIGAAYSILPEFTDAESLRSAIKQAQFGGAVSSPLVHFYSSWARMAKSFQK